MRFVVTVMVRDEIDVIAAVIEHTLAQEPDLVVVTDNGSVDGTTEVLQRYADLGLVEPAPRPGAPQAAALGGHGDGPARQDRARRRLGAEHRRRRVLGARRQAPHPACRARAHPCR
ncbi:hypothetical protein GCM10025868_24590 [Angustibacter aerolatus]|uniref:Glycosyltransferase 2-like domain-containing protein n=1 Tax=Angustibacter aerolatus TaxID=1162965 RepID=A0ABQ6JHB8_9ACTN|nr:glycosyltransferase [Angustibacter aerolatus]GMA87209.1 hypothetical protein GCM10025868_24590 [Angustibacter aerolatus]